MIPVLVWADRWVGSLSSLKITLLLLSITGSVSILAQPLPVAVRGDGIEEPLTDQPGRIDAGRAVFADRQTGHCLLCHAVVSIDEPFQGNVGPDLSKGTALSEAQLRLRLVDSTQVNPDTVMPSYYRIDGLTQVANSYQGKPALSAQQIEDLIAYLRSLRSHEKR